MGVEGTPATPKLGSATGCSYCTCNKRIKIVFLLSGANMLSCPNHPDVNLIEDYHAGDMVCPECGLVVGDRFVITTSFLTGL